MIRRTPFLAFALFALLLCPALTGCSLYESWGDEQVLIKQLQQDKVQLAAQLTQINNTHDAASKQAQELQQRESVIRQTIAQVSQQLATTDPGPAYDAIENTLEKLRQQRREIQGQADTAVSQAARYAALQVQTQSQIQLTDEALARSALQIKELEAQINGTAVEIGNTIRDVGAALDTAGLKGAGPATAAAANVWGLATGGVLTLIGGFFARKKAKEALAANEQAAVMTTAAKEIVGSIEIAREANGELDHALRASAGIINKYQDKPAKAIVDQVQKENRANAA